LNEFLPGRPHNLFRHRRVPMADSPVSARPRLINRPFMPCSGLPPPRASDRAPASANPFDSKPSWPPGLSSVISLYHPSNPVAPTSANRSEFLTRTQHNLFLCSKPARKLSLFGRRIFLDYFPIPKLSHDNDAPAIIPFHLFRAPVQSVFPLSPLFVSHIGRPPSAPSAETGHLF